MLFNLPITPLLKLYDTLFATHGIQVYVKQLYLTDVAVSGNKWYKLKYNLLEAKQQHKHTLLTFGGAYSNHIAASAAAGARFGFKTIGIIRGELHQPLNATLSQAAANGMHLHYVDRTTYRRKEEELFINELRQQFGDFYLVPEGGANALGIKGCTEIMDELKIDFDYICCPCGTGSTLTGLIAGLMPHQQAIGFSALKGGSFLIDLVAEALAKSDINTPLNWTINFDYHFGGYAKTTPPLLHFIKLFEAKHALPLDYVYTGKMVYGIYDLISKGYFKKGETIIILHTGGLQGNQT